MSDLIYILIQPIQIVEEVALSLSIISHVAPEIGVLSVEMDDSGKYLYMECFSSLDQSVLDLKINSIRANIELLLDTEIYIDYAEFSLGEYND